MDLKAETRSKEERLFTDKKWRVRSVKQGPEGFYTLVSMAERFSGSCPTNALTNALFLMYNWIL
jgi:hypothetical protein